MPASPTATPLAALWMTTRQPKLVRSASTCRWCCIDISASYHGSERWSERRQANHNHVGLTQLSHSASQRRVFACGSMVRCDHMFVVFAHAERENDKREKSKYHSAEGSERQLRKSYHDCFEAK